jgi:hypothetical protein
MEGYAVFENTIKGRFFAKAYSPDSSILKLSNEDYLKRISEGKDIYVTRARVWAGYDKWTTREAASLLSGLVPAGDDSAKFFHKFCWSETEKDESTNPCRYIIFKIFSRNRECEEHIFEILKRSDMGGQASPRKWAEYAKTKGWLPHAESFADIDNSPLLILLESTGGSALLQSSENGPPIAQPKPDSPYSTAWLSIQNRAIAQFFSPRRNFDAKSEEVVEWIMAETAKVGLKESRKVAEAIFTMIKPDDHDPKKKRGNPL